MKRILALVFTLAMLLSCAVFTVSAEDGAPASFCLMDGASVRLDEEHSGLRFETRIKTSELEALGEGVVIGTLILPTDLKDGDITVNTPGVKNLSTETEGARLSIDGEYTVFYAAIIDILPENYARKFSAVSYIKIGDSYYYTDYSDENNSRSVYGVAAAAWEAEAKDNPIVKAYLDKVVHLSGALRQIAIKDYVSPFSVSYEGGKLVFSGASALAKSDLASVVIDDVVYTGGWDVVDGKLTAPYATLVYENYNSYPSTTVTNESANAQIGTDPGIRMIVNKRLDGNANVDSNACATLTSVDAASKSLGYIKTSWSGKDGVGGVINCTTPSGGLANGFKNGETTLSISMSLMIPEDCATAPTCNFNFRSGGTSTRIPVLRLRPNNNGEFTLNTLAPVARLQKGVFVDVTVVFDFANNMTYGYCNGELTATAQNMLPANMLDYMKNSTSVYVFDGQAFCNGTAGTAGICIDNVVVRTY